MVADGVHLSGTFLDAAEELQQFLLMSFKMATNRAKKKAQPQFVRPEMKYKKYHAFKAEEHIIRALCST